jgi:UDP-N-acetylglucosamine 2-epimerase (non-hydrolysing)
LDERITTKGERMRVATILGTRPEIIRLSRVIPVLERYTEHVLIHTGQNYDYELNQVFFDDLQVRKPDYFLQVAGRSAAETIAAVIARSDEVLGKVQPDAVLILGDTNSSLAAISAKRRKIPIFHMEAGNRCFDDRVPEEINRRIVDHISDINLPYSNISREYLLREGISPDRIIKTGSPMYEVLHYYLSKIRESNVLDRLSVRKGEYFVVSSHREENVDDPHQLRRFVCLLNRIVEVYGHRVIVSTHPRTKNRMADINATLRPEVEFLVPFGFFDYVQLQLNARATLSDSGTISEESSILGFPALNLREAHERPEAMEEGAVMLTGFDPDRVIEGLKVLEDQTDSSLRLATDYQVPNVSEKVVRIILSYVDFVNRTVWRKQTFRTVELI